MFHEIHSKLINLDDVRLIEDRSTKDSSKVLVTFRNGDTLLIDEAFSRLSGDLVGQILPAPTGYQVIEGNQDDQGTWHFSLWPILAFRMGLGDGGEPYPITAIGDPEADVWGVVLPDGRVNQLHLQIFPSVEAFKAQCSERKR